MKRSTIAPEIKALGFASLVIACAVQTAGAFPGPDVITNDIPDIANHGAVGGIRAYTLGSGTCNIGTSVLEWINDGSPGYAMNAYRLANGRLEQVGQSWVKTACCAAQGSGCGMTCVPTGGGLGPGCRDVYGAGWNQSQPALGPRSGINAWSGTFAAIPGGGAINVINRRLQIAEADMSAATFPGALYFVEGVYVSTGDATNNNRNNNASYQRVTINASFVMSLVAGSFNKAVPIIQAWRDHGNGLNTPDPTIQITNVDVPSEGRFVTGARVRDNGNGTWTYDYAVFNLSSDRSGGSFSVPLPAGAVVTNVGFHDVNSHSGEPYANTDWISTVSGSSVTWNSPQTFAQNPNSNAIRWGTMYNFWFTANKQPGNVSVTLGLFKPHTPSSVSYNAHGPITPNCFGDVLANGTVDLDDLLAVINNFGATGTPGSVPGDVNGNGVVDMDDLIGVINAWGRC